VSFHNREEKGEHGIGQKGHRRKMRGQSQGVDKSAKGGKKIGWVWFMMEPHLWNRMGVKAKQEEGKRDEHCDNAEKERGETVTGSKAFSDNFGGN